MTEAEKLELFKTFRRKSAKDDGRIIKDEANEVIEVDFAHYKRTLAYYGHWSKFAGIFVVVFGVLYVDTQSDLAIAKWASSEPEDQKANYKINALKITGLLLINTVLNCIRQYLVRLLISGTMGRVHKEVI